MESSKKRGAYIKGEASDWVVREFIAKKEYLLQFNPSGKAGGAALRNSAAEALTADFNAKFPGCAEKSYGQLKEHFDSRRDGIKKILARVNQYTTGTGGGRDPEAEVLVAKLANASEADNQLVTLLKRTPGIFGVGDPLLETGHDMEVVMRGRIDEEEGMEDIACGSRVMSKIAKKKPSSSKMMSMGGVKKAQDLSTAEWLKAAGPLMERNAVRLGFRGQDRAVVKREREGERDADSEVSMKKRKIEETQLSQIASGVEAIQQQMSSFSQQAQAAISVVEQLRALLRFGGDTSAQTLNSLIANYDRSLSAIGPSTSMAAAAKEGLNNNEDVVYLG